MSLITTQETAILSRLTATVPAAASIARFVAEDTAELFRSSTQLPALRLAFEKSAHADPDVIGSNTTKITNTWVVLVYYKSLNSPTGATNGALELAEDVRDALRGFSISGYPTYVTDITLVSGAGGFIIYGVRFYIAVRE